MSELTTQEPKISNELHPDTAKLVRRFARALGLKLLEAQRKYGYSNGWIDPNWMNICRAQLMVHIHKGDPRDVAAYCAFLWHHNESTQPPSDPDTVHFQMRVHPWMQKCFGAEISADTIERNHRFFEEAAELVQACGMSASEAHQLVDYTWSRPIGEKVQEVGGVMVTLAALCLANGLDMHAAGETELARINDPVMVEKIRAKQASKPKHSPIPTASQPDQTLTAQLNAAYAALDAVADWAWHEDANSETGSGTRLLELLLKHGVHPRASDDTQPATGDNP